MWHRIKAWGQLIWAIKTRKERTTFLIKIVSAFVMASVSFFALGFHHALILCEQYWNQVTAYIEANPYHFGIGTISGLTSFFFFYRILHEKLYESVKWTERSLPVPPFLSFSQAYADSGYKLEKICVANKTYSVIYSQAVNNVLCAQTWNPPVKKNGSWLFPSMMEDVRTYALLRAADKGAIFNSAKVRLKTDLLYKDSRLPEMIEVQKTTYFSSLATNEISFLEISERRTPDVQRQKPWASSFSLYDGVSLFLDKIEDGLKLRSLYRSNCSNHIGVSTLALTLDGIMLTVGNSNKNLQSQCLLVPSGSGSVDWEDMKKEKNFLDIVKRAAERELAEECGFISRKYEMKTTVIGFARFIDRGGKPEFFCLSVLNKEFSEIQSAHSTEEKLYTADLFSIQLNKEETPSAKERRAAISEFCAKNEGDISVSLKLNLEFLLTAIEHNPSLLCPSFERKPFWRRFFG